MDNGRMVISDTHLQAVLDMWSRNNEWITCSVIGNCMAPSIREGNAITMRVGAKDVKVGDVVVFGSPSKFFVKRVVRIHRRGREAFLLTKGDRNPDFFGQISRAQVLGKVLEVRGSHGNFNFNSCFWRILNRFLAVRSYLHGNRRSNNSLIWRGINTFFSCRSRMLPRNFSTGPFLWKGICKAHQIWSTAQKCVFYRKRGA
jgi:signal peptidase I